MERETHVSPDQPLSQSAAVKVHSESKSREPLLKRPLDIILSILMIILSLPVSLPIALAIKLEDGGPILYRQKGDPGIDWNVLMIERTSKIGRVV